MLRPSGNLSAEYILNFYKKVRNLDDKPASGFTGRHAIQIKHSLIMLCRHPFLQQPYSSCTYIKMRQNLTIY